MTGVAQVIQQNKICMPSGQKENASAIQLLIKEFSTTTTQPSRLSVTTTCTYLKFCFPENGYKYVKFHIDGKDFKNYHRSDIEHLRTRVATLLCVPLQYVFIRGIEPSSSLVVTLMIPEMYVDILHNLLNQGEDFADLHKLGVDAIELDGKTPFNIKGILLNIVLKLLL